jgi:hypothetical protein
MTTISITVPDLKAITRGLSSDWGPTLHAASRRLGAVVALIYTLGFMAGESWHQLVAWAQKHQLHGLARLGLLGGNLKAGLTGSATEDSSAASAMVVGIDFAGPEGSATVQTIVQRRPGGNLLVVQRLAPALPPARQAANVAPPSIRHLAAQGCSINETGRLIPAGTLLTTDCNPFLPLTPLAPQPQ